MDLSPRVIDGIKRYLANAQGVLAPAKAVDFVFQFQAFPRPGHVAAHAGQVGGEES